MADNKKYYYLKLKDNFYDSEQLIILQNMQDGYLYSDILMKLYLRSLKTEGKLMFNNLIPYTPSILAQVVRHQVGTVEKALKIFQELGLIEILENGAIYMLDIQNFIGKSSTEADRIRNYRKDIKQEQLGYTDNVQMYNKSTPEIEKEIEIEIEIEKEIEDVFDFYSTNIHTITAIESQKLEDWLKIFPCEMIKHGIEICVLNNARTFKYLEAILNNWKNKGYRQLSDIQEENPKKTNKKWWEEDE